MSVKPTPHSFRHRIYIIIFIIAAIAITGIIFRIMAFAHLRNVTNEEAVLRVATTKAEGSPINEELVLPGNVQAWHEATVYARTNGYIIKWIVDIGAHVKQGDLLAEIASPEVDAQLRQTEADLKTAEANNQLAQTTAIRWKNLLKTDSVSKQETDEKVSDAQAKTAIVKATRANRDRLLELVSFQKVIAPFDGVIMSRTTDIGRLINAGSGTLPPLFRIVQTDRLRIYVRVPQNFSSSIKPGLIVKLRFNQHPGKTYSAKLLDTARAIDNTTRTLLVQFEIDNKDNDLLAGSYTEVHLTLPAIKGSVNLPVNTLIFRAQGLQVATIDGDSKALLKSITIGRDFGDFVEVSSGLTAGETVILNPPDSLISGQKVRIIPTQSSDTGSKK